MSTFDVAVIGLGALGSAAAYHAAGKGAKVIAFEQFELGHVRGASHDTSRIVRTAYNTPEYVNLAKRAYKDWAELERVAGIKLLNVTGGLMFFAKDGPMPVTKYEDSLTANNVPFESLTAQDVKHRWPQFNVPSNVDAVYTADTGMVHASRSVATMQLHARARGAAPMEHTRVQSITPQSSGNVRIETSNGLYFAGKVILAADAWTNELLRPLGRGVPLTMMQEQVTYFKPSDPDAFKPAKFPVWIWGGDEWFYGFPTFGEPTIKAARDVSENLMTPEERTYVPSRHLIDQPSSFMNSMITDPDRQELRTVTCQYVLTPDRQFVIGTVPDYQNIIVGLGAGHAFKFAPTIGRILAELAVEGTTTDDIGTFAFPKLDSAVHARL